MLPILKKIYPLNPLLNFDTKYIYFIFTIGKG